jgi:hypothetical protein
MLLNLLLEANLTGFGGSVTPVITPSILGGGWELPAPRKKRRDDGLADQIRQEAARAEQAQALAYAAEIAALDAKRRAHLLNLALRYDVRQTTTEIALAQNVLAAIQDAQQQLARRARLRDEDEAVLLMFLRM